MSESWSDSGLSSFRSRNASSSSSSSSSSSAKDTEDNDTADEGDDLSTLSAGSRTSPPAPRRWRRVSLVPPPPATTTSYSRGSRRSSAGASTLHGELEILTAEKSLKQSEVDSGLDSADGSLTSAEEDASDSEEETEESCDEGCLDEENVHATVIRSWLRQQADRDRNLLDNDLYFKERRPVLWPSEKIVDRANCTFDPFPELSAESFRFAGSRDRLGLPHGRGAAYFPNGRKFVGVFSHGSRQGPGELIEREGRRLLAGPYEGDKLHGVVEIATNEGGTLEMTFVRGVAHGPARRFSPEGTLQWVVRKRKRRVLSLTYYLM